jgi:hypothetical protein
LGSAASAPTSPWAHASVPSSAWSM